MNPTSPRQTLLGLVNAYPKNDIQLWKILKLIASGMSDLQSDAEQISQSISWTARIYIQITTGTDIALYWPRVYIPRDSSGNILYSSMMLKTVGISAHTIPSSALILDLLVSSNSGTDFTSVFNDPTLLQLPTNAQTITYGNLTKMNMKDKYLFRVDCTQTGGVDTIELYLSGYYVPFTPNPNVKTNLI